VTYLEGESSAELPKVLQNIRNNTIRIVPA
jgi:hypothetical protein